MTQNPRFEEEEIQKASFKWPRTGVTGTGRKVKCPDCGIIGFAGGKWTWAHISHTVAPCGKKYVTGRYLQHRVHCDTCRALPK